MAFSGCGIRPEHRAVWLEDAGDRAGRAVEIVRLGEAAVGGAIAEGDQALAFEPVERIGVGGVVAVVMGDRHPDRLAGIVAAGKDRLAVLDPQMDVAAGKAHRPVRQKAPGRIPASVRI